MFRRKTPVPARKDARNRRLTLAALVLGLFITACSTLRSELHSDLTVPAGIRFELGGNQTGAFTVKARNVGTVTVTLVEQLSDGQRRALGTFEPGGRQTIRFARGSMAIVDNTASATDARLDLLVTGETNLRMKNQKP